MKSASPIAGLILLIAFTPQGATGQKRQTARSAQPKLKSIVRKASASTNSPSAQEEAILAEINLARSNPSQYIRYLDDFRRYYHGKELRFPDGQSLITKEGVSALDEAISFLRSIRPVPPLEVRKVWCWAQKIT